MTDSSVIDFEDPAPRSVEPVQLVLDLDGFEGPIDLLLVLAREQKVDLTRISILQLADQYLAFVQRARQASLELAADYLVMAAWLAYLKSRLLLPSQDDEAEPSGEELAEALAFQLRRLEAMREAGQRLMARDLLGRDVFARGAADGITVIQTPIYSLSLYDVIKAYADQARRGRPTALSIRSITSRAAAGSSAAMYSAIVIRSSLAGNDHSITITGGPCQAWQYGHAPPSRPRRETPDRRDPQLRRPPPPLGQTIPHDRDTALWPGS